MSKYSRLRLIVLQRVCPGYRVALFRQISSSLGASFKLLIGDDPPGKLRSSPDLGGINVDKCTTYFIRFGRRVMPLHFGLWRRFNEMNPGVIICEGESHFVGYLAALVYKHFYNRRVRVVHWCFIALPGERDGGSRFRIMIKSITRKLFDGFIVYSSYSKIRLQSAGAYGKPIFVVTNVGDVDRFLLRGGSPSGDAETVQNLIGRRFVNVVTFCGTLDEVKRPDIVLSVARLMPEVEFIICGVGPLELPLRRRLLKEGLSNVSIVGSIGKELPSIYGASSALIVPGRGGIVISEALACGCPVIVHEADGTELDLVIDGETGYIVREGSAEAFSAVLMRILKDPKLSRRMRSNARALIASKFNTREMANSMLSAASSIDVSLEPVCVV